MHDQLGERLQARAERIAVPPGDLNEVLAGGRRRLVLRRMVAAAGVASLAALAVVFMRADVFEQDLFERRQQVAGPPTASPEPSAEQEEAVGERFRILRRILTSVPGWAMTPAADDNPSLHRCEGDWMDGPGGRGSGANLGLSVNPDDPPPVATGTEIEGFLFPAHAERAMDRLIRNLTSCTAESWDSQPIGQTGAVLAFSDAGVVWIHQKGTSVATLAVATTDGPPPLGVQVEVADLIYSWFCTDCDD